MRVLFLRSNPVDPDTRVEKEVNSLLRRGYAVDVFGWDRSADYPIKSDVLHLPAGDARIFRAGIRSQFGGGMKKNLLPMLRFQARVFRFVRRHRRAYDVIHACDLDTGFAAMLALRGRTRFVYDIFDYYADAFAVPRRLRPAIERMECSVIHRADATIICTEERRAQLKNSTPRRVYVIHNSPAELVIEKGFGLKGTCGRIRIVYAGIFGTGRKLLELCRFVARNPAFELHIAGFGALEEAIRACERESDNIFFYGKLPYAKVLALEAQCDILPALYDPRLTNHRLAAPNKFYEALYLGKPTVMAEGSGMSGVVTAHDIGAVVPFEAFEMGFERLATRKAEWDGMAKRAKVVYADQFSWAEMERRLYALYDALG